MVDNRTTELSLVFVLVGMMFLVPVITGEALGRTEATVKAYKIGAHPTLGLTPGFVEKRLDEGKWVVEPNCFSNECKWTTEGTGAFGGPEAGHVIYNYNFMGSHVGKVVFRWYNPRSGANTCGAVVLDKAPVGRFEANCYRITQGNFATAEYHVYYYR